MYIADLPEKSAFESISLQSGKKESVSFHWQFSESYTLIYVIRGQGRRFVGDFMGDFSAEDFVLIPPRMPFAYVSDYEYTGGGVEYISIRFSPKFAGGKFFNIPEMSRCSGLLKRAERAIAIHEVPNALASIIKTMASMKHLNKLLTFLTVLDSLAELPVEVLTKESYRPCISKDDMRRTQEVCFYMNSHYERSVSSKELGGLVSMSPPSFCRFFKRVMNKTFHYYLCEIRIALAKRLLKNSELPMEEISKRCGFKTVPGFTARFKDLTQHTPAAFRRSERVK